MIDRSRRNFLKTSAGALALLHRFVGSRSGLVCWRIRATRSRLMPFPLASVRLAPGIFHEQKRSMRAISTRSRLTSSCIPSHHGGHIFTATPYKGGKSPPANCAAILPAATFSLL